MSAAKPTREEAVAKALASDNETTRAEIATATGLDRSTVGKALAALQRAGSVRRHQGGRDGRARVSFARFVVSWASGAGRASR